MKAAIAIIVIILAASGIFFLFKNNSQYNPPTDRVNPIISDTSTSSQYTLADVSMHPDAKSCWSVINGKVYNLTSWIGQHPGGEDAILSICGKDGSQAFNIQHGTSKKQADILATFFIGNLK